ncbi:Cyclin-U2-1 [Fulvia fulva]|uniref:Cyclin-U2-1 n=1 Tax=Passalora fulva TaxID=5499 RepID=A0A9Q8LD17_PASFU|nr:Cyclin-U2-1 [Fulvia fulva]KAK4630723.1 Cyclin-U2-1 [Fulvia fulva]UJO15245.1 Cyclin-U2-1 [Fulvia fulva]
MDDGASHPLAVSDPAPPGSPPPPPDPNVDDATAAVPLCPTPTPKTDDPLHLSSEQWDINSVSALGALRMLIEALDKLANATGDVPPTPPVSRPTTPSKLGFEKRHFRKSSSSLRLAQGASGVPATPIGSPEAHPHEPLTVEIGAHAQDMHIQHAALARRFFSKTAPPFTLSAYLMRLHQYCPHSPGVYLAASAYIHHLCAAELIVPATSRTIHRLSLAAIRVAAKALEDNKWAQERVAKVGGVSNGQLLSLEVTMCFLLDFELYVDERIMARRMFLLQEAAATRHGMGSGGKLGEQFKLRLPMRVRGNK